MGWLEKLSLYAVIALAYSAACMLGGYEYSQSRIAKQALKLETKAEQNTQQLVQQNAVAAQPIVERIVETKWRTQVVTKEVPVVQTIEVPGQCPQQPQVECPAAVTPVDRLLIDAAARNTDPPAGPPVDAAPYPAGPLTASVVTNYGRCNVCIAQLGGLQDYVNRTLVNQRLLCPQR